MMLQKEESAAFCSSDGISKLLQEASVKAKKLEIKKLEEKILEEISSWTGLARQCILPNDHR